MSTADDQKRPSLILYIVPALGSMSLGLAVYDLLTGGDPLLIAFGFAAALFATLGFFAMIHA